MFDDKEQVAQRNNAITVSWWSWRPGIRPGRALLLGISLMCIACFFLLAGSYSLISLIIDTNSPPARVPATVTGYTSGILDSQSHLSIRVPQQGKFSTITPAITPAERLAIHIGDPVTLDYSPRLRYLYALEDHGQHFTLPGGSPQSGLFPSIGLILLGLLFFPYPLLLTLWSWQDLRTPEKTIRGKVIGLRASQQVRSLQQRRALHPGLTPRIGRAWYGVALASTEATSQPPIITFTIRQERYKELHEGQVIQVVYSSHLHHVLSIRFINDDTTGGNSSQEQTQ